MTTLSTLYSLGCYCLMLYFSEIILFCDAIFGFNRGKKLFSFYYNFICGNVHAIYFRDFDNSSFTYELQAWVLLECHLFLSFSLHPRKKSVCFWNAVWCVSIAVTMQIVQDQVREVSLVTPLSKNYMVQHKSCTENQTTYFTSNNFFSKPVLFMR